MISFKNDGKKKFTLNSPTDCRGNWSENKKRQIFLCKLFISLELGVPLQQLKFLQNCQCIFTMSLLSPLAKVQHFIYSNWIPLSKEYYVSSYGKMGQRFLRKKWKREKFKITIIVTDNRNISIRKTHLSLWLASVSLKFLVDKHEFHKKIIKADLLFLYQEHILKHRGNTENFYPLHFLRKEV